MKPYYCPNCKEPVKEIKEIYNHVIEKRKWDGENYELTESSDELVITVCGKCGNVIK